MQWFIWCFDIFFISLWEFQVVIVWLIRYSFVCFLILIWEYIYWFERERNNHRLPTIYIFPDPGIKPATFFVYGTVFQPTDPPGQDWILFFRSALHWLYCILAHFFKKKSFLLELEYVNAHAWVEEMKIILNFYVPCEILP